jgi:hypothetical protein
MILSRDRHIKWIFYLLTVAYFLGILYPLTENLLFKRLSYGVMFLIPIYCSQFLIVKTKSYAFVVFLICYLFFMLLVGLISHNWSSYILFDVKNFFLLSILLVPFTTSTKDYIIKELPGQMATWLYIGLPLSWYFILTVGLNPASAGNRMVVDVDSMNFGFDYLFKFIDFSVLLLPFIKSIKGIKKILVIFSVFTFLLVSFFSVTRGATLVCILSFLSMIYLNISKSNRFYEGLKMLVVISVVTLITIQVYGTDKLSSNFSYFLNRMTAKENFTTYRSAELFDFLKFSSKDEIIFGRGMGGAHNYGIWSGPQGLKLVHGMNMTHYGFLYLILKGGVVLLIILYGWTIFSMIKLWRYGGSYKSFSIVIFLYLFYEISIPKFYDPFYLFLLLLSIYLSKNLPTLRKRNKIILMRQEAILNP